MTYNSLLTSSTNNAMPPEYGESELALLHIASCIVFRRGVQAEPEQGPGVCLEDLTVNAALRVFVLMMFEISNMDFRFALSPAPSLEKQHPPKCTKIIEN